MKCEHCGAKIDDDSVFCISCGKKVEEKDVTTKYQKKPEKTAQRNKLKLILAIVIPIVVIGATFGILTVVGVFSKADLDPSWSPDGKKIAFVSDRDGNRDIYVMNADG